MATDFGDAPEPIAIVGLGCRFPGGAETPELLWDLLRQGKNAWAEFPRDRLNVNGFYHPSPERDDSFNFKGAHFITSNVAAFDAKFFGVASQEADAIDPQQRMLLEVSYEALENAGIPKEEFVGSKTCVFIGSFVKDYEQVSMRDAQTTAPDCATGNSIAIMSNRISYSFDFSGTSQTIETGCSASLVSLHQAVNNLRSGQSNMAIAGGAGLILTPATIMPMTSLGFLSEDGKCWTFDHRANGYGRGEGIGIVVMKRLSDALRDNDTIRAVIRGTASNQDGHTPGITVPNPEAQVGCINEAYANAKLSKDLTTYVECHGTGTKVGDWRELKAISAALAHTKPKDQPMIVGSIKPNIGHLEGSAGVAGLIRAVLILEKGKVPPHINFEKWNPDIKHEEWRVDVAHKELQLTSKIRRASVNCFGFGGTNAHAVIEDGGSFLTEYALAGQHNSSGPQYSVNAQRLEDVLPPRLFVFSAQHIAGLEETFSAYNQYLQSSTNTDVRELLSNLSYTLYKRRSLLDYRASFVARTTEDLQQALVAFDSAQATRASSKQSLNIALVFCGQGAQWARMGLSLLNTVPFRKSILTAQAFLERLMKDIYVDEFDLIAHLQASAEDSQIDLPEISQSATTAVQVALVDLLQAMNIQPVAVVGHSSGEIAAAYAAGHISREKAWELAAYRGYAAGQVSQIDSTVQGSMIAVGVDGSEASRIVANLVTAGEIKAGSVRVACINSPRLVTLSGDKDGILSLKAHLEGNNIFHRLLKVDTAYHSHHMELVAKIYQDMISHTQFDKSSTAMIPKTAQMYSSVYGKLVQAETTACAGYWVKNMVARVEFVKAVKAMMNDQDGKGTKPNFFIEVSPHGTLASAVRDILDDKSTRQESPLYFPALSKGLDDQQAMLGVVSELWKVGHRANMDAFYNPNRPKCLVDLPRYAWDHSKTYWHESHLSRQHRFREFGSRDLIGAPTTDAVLPFEPRWRGHFRLQENPWMADHKVQGEMIYPASGMVAMALEAGKQVVWDHIDSVSDILDYEVSKFQIKAPMVIPADETGLEHCINAKRIYENNKHGVTTWKYEFAIYSKPGRDPPFVENACGVLTVRFQPRGSVKRSHYTPRVAMPAIEDSESDMTPFEFYEGLDVIGMQYGPLFRNIKRIDSIRDEGEQKACSASMAIPNTKDSMPKKFEFDHVIHPATLDTMFQSVFTLGSEPMVPYYIDSIRIQASMPVAAGTGLLMNTNAGRTALREVTANVVVSEQCSTHASMCNKLVEIKGLRAMAVATSAAGNLRFLPNHRHLCSEMQWKPDVAYAGFDDFPAWLAALGHKIPGLTILHVGQNVEVVKNVFDTLASGLSSSDRGKPSAMHVLGKYTIRGMDNKAADKLEEELSTAQFLLADISSDSSETLDSSEKYDLVMIEANSTEDRASIVSHVKPAGFLVVHPDQIKDADGELSGKDLKGVQEVGSNTTVAKPPFELYTKPVPRRITTYDVAILLPSAALGKAGLVTELVELLEKEGMKTTLVGRDWLDTTCCCKDDNMSVISLLELENFGEKHVSTNEQQVFEMTGETYQQIKNLLEKPKNLLWVSQDAQMQCAKPKNAPFQGWSRVVRSEDAQKNIVTVDVVPDSATLQSLAPQLARIFMDSFFAGSQETEFCLQDGNAHIPRLVPLVGLNYVLEEGRDRAVFFETASLNNNPRGPLKLDIGAPGDLSTLFYRVDEDGSRDLRPGEVRLAVKATQILPVDLETVMGRGTEKSVGLDVYGKVQEIHPSCNITGGLALGVEVVAKVRGTVRSHVIVPAKMIHKVYEQKMPNTNGINGHANGNVHANGNGHANGKRVIDIEHEPQVSHDELIVNSLTPWSPSTLAAIRMFITAYRGHCHLSPPTNQMVEQVIIFGAESTFGQALVQLLHAEKLFLNAITLVVDRVDEDATDVSKESNGKAVYKTGGDRVPVREGQVVMDDENLVDKIMDLTSGRGANVIFDMSLGGHDVVPEVIRPGGAVFGFKSGSPTNRVTFRSDVTVWRADFFGGNDWRDKKDEVEHTFELMEDTQVGPLAKYPNFHTMHNFSHVADAFKDLAQSPNRGAHILEATDSQQVRVGFSPVEDDLELKQDASYMIVGGFGGLGRDIALWLASMGAKHLIFVSRRNHAALTNPEDEHIPTKASALIENLEAQGVKTYILAEDICDKSNLKSGLLRLQKKAPKICGVIHAAGVLEDYTYRNMTYDSWEVAARVKTVGSWNLHEELPKDLDFLIFLSSAAGVIGNRGQANYAAGNAFQDALARHRHAQGMHTVSMDLGPILAAGMVDQEMMDLLKSVGFFGIRRSDFHFVLERAILGNGVQGEPFPPQVVLGVGTGGLIRQNKPADPFWAHTALFAHLNRLDLDGVGLGGDDDGSSGGGLGLLDLQPRLKLASTMEEAVGVILPPLIEAMVSVIPNLTVEDVRPDMTPTECQSDSMRGTYIDNWLRRTTGVSIGQGINAMPIRAICEEVVRRGGFSAADA